MWRDQRILDLFGIEIPLIQAPMAGASSSRLAIAVSEAGALGSLPCAMLNPDEARRELDIIRQQTTRPFNVNFFCHAEPRLDEARDAAWKNRLEPYCHELGISAPTPAGPVRMPFNEAMCDLIVEYRPSVVSFHFGLPDSRLLDRVKGAGARIISSATTVEEARWLEARGCDAVIAQGNEAGGHRGMFLDMDVASQPGTFALVPQVCDAVRIPVIAAGGIADARGIAAAFALGAAAVQIGTAYLFCPESLASPFYRSALAAAHDTSTVLTNVFTGRPARMIKNRFIRELGPIRDAVPDFPLAAQAVAALRAKSEAAASPDFAPQFAGQSAALAREAPAGELTKSLAAETLALMQALAKPEPAR
jgi:nitronate monooxygenase